MSTRNACAHKHAPRFLHAQVEGAGHVQRFEILHPGERNLVVAPAAANRDRNLVDVLTLKTPVVERGDVFDDVDRVDITLGLDIENE